MEDLDPMLQSAVKAGLMTLEEAWRVDDYAGQLALAVDAGLMTQERAEQIAAAKAVRDASRRGKG